MGIFIGQNWILPNFNGLKSTLPRFAPQVLVIFTGRGKASFLRGGAGQTFSPPNRAACIPDTHVVMYFTHPELPLAGLP